MKNDTQAPASICVSEREAARMLGVSSRTLFAWRRAGLVRVVKIGGPKARVLYPVIELEQFVAANCAATQA